MDSLKQRNINCSTTARKELLMHAEYHTTDDITVQSDNNNSLSSYSDRGARCVGVKFCSQTRPSDLTVSKMTVLLNSKTMK